jgi:TPR repeat protein
MKYIIYFLINFSLLFANSKGIQLPFPDDTAEAQKEEVTPPSQKEEVSANLETQSLEPKDDNLPNLKTKKKKKKSETEQDLQKGAYARGNYHLNRADINRATIDFKTSISGEGLVSYKSKLEMIRLLAQERKIQEAKTMIDGIENLEQKYEAMFELAMGLQNSAKTKEEKEESLALYLFILTEAPSEESNSKKFLAKTLWTVGVLLFQLEDYLSALDHLSRLITQYSDSDYYDDALYLSGRIYEEGKNPQVKNLQRAKKYYEIFLSQINKDQFKNSIYLKEVQQRYSRLKNL